MSGSGGPSRNALTIRNLAYLTGLTLSALTAVLPSDAVPAQYNARPVWQVAGGGETLTVLKVEELPKIGRVVHVRVDKVPVPACQEFVSPPGSITLPFPKR